MYPPHEIEPRELRLKDFKDQREKRPKGRNDLFV
jgi:hypothetical protein